MIAGRRFLAGGVLAGVAILAGGLLPSAASASTYSVPPSPAPTTDPSGAQRARIIRSYERMPLAFEENRGQAPPGVRYLAHGPGYGIALNRTGIHVALAG